MKKTRIEPVHAVRAHAALAINPVAFAEQLGYAELDKWQRDLLLSNEQKVILNCARQAGKSSLTAVLALHHALYNPGALELVISAGYRQATEFFRKVTGFYQQLGRPVPSDAENKHTLELRNKSRIVSLPCSGQTIRGFSAPSLIVIDEAAQTPDDVYDALTPMLAVSGGRLILLSTPWGRRGFFFREWQEGKGWLKLKITAEECPRISKEWLEDRRAFMSEWKFKQEYMAEFGENAAGVFSLEDIENAFDDPRVRPLFDKDGNLDVPMPDTPVKRGMLDSLGWEL